MSIQLSYSAATKYKMSPRAYYLHYILRLRSENNSSPLFFGNAMDLGLNTLLKQKQDNQEINIQLAKDEFIKAWEYGEVDGERIQLFKPGCVKFSKSDYDESIFTHDDIKLLNTDGYDRSWVSMKRKGLMMIDAYVEQVLPKLEKVHFVQKQIKITNDSGDTFVGFIDFCADISGKTYIMDNKTSSIKYAADAVETSEQLSTYYEAMRDDLKIDGAGYVVIPKKMRKQKMPLVPIEIRLGEINEELIEKTFSMYDEVLEGIKLGKFECNPELCASTPWGCSYEKYCASNGKDMTGLKFYKKSSR